MKLKQVLIFQLEEMQNEFASALEGLASEHWQATPLETLNSIGWIACHCVQNRRVSPLRRSVVVYQSGYNRNHPCFGDSLGHHVGAFDNLTDFGHHNRASDAVGRQD